MIKVHCTTCGMTGYKPKRLKQRMLSREHVTDLLAFQRSATVTCDFLWEAECKRQHTRAALQDVVQEISSVLTHYQADLAANKRKEKEVTHITSECSSRD